MDLSYIINELGEERGNYFNAVAPPIMQTSNFRVEKVDELKKLFEDEYGGYLYSRGQNPTVEILRKKLAALDQAEDCLVFNSGMAAIFAAVLASTRSGDHIISVENPYGWVKRIFDNTLSRFGVETTYIDGTVLENFEKARRPNTRFIYLESPNSWTYALQDIAGVAGFSKKHGITTLMDNTYCGPLYQQPIPLGIDLCMQTATKYIGGHSDTLGGILTGSKDRIKKIFSNEYLAVGSGIQPFNAWLLIRGLRTLESRMSRITASTWRVLDYLRENKRVERLLFPLDPGFPQYELARNQMKNACGLISFYVKAESRQQIVSFCEGLKHIMMAVSWGGHESLILPRCAALENQQFERGNPDHRMLRLYVGLEDPDYLIRDLEQSFGRSF
ncbi:MAG: aminotransferase class I/II-fold pyridoxal phosphate-dependent enzyme [Bacteroidota bacterium]|nr:aminotransferase class I/II-fold pyridoxal phosphate-dependent enzyme [Bacteroidota bacterium]